MISIVSDEFNELRKKVEKDTGFACFEPTRSEQPVFYGTSDKLADFKAMVEGYIPTGTMVYVIDTKGTEIWSDYKQTWY